MPTSGRQSFRSRARSEQGDDRLYPNLSGMDIEMSNLEEDRVSSNYRQNDYLFFKLHFLIM